MSVSSVGSSYTPPPIPAATQAAPVTRASTDSDGDSDGSGAKAVQAAATSTVNLGGQKIGQLVNIAA